MKERPILFSGAMIRALLARTKRQTRRVFQVQRRARLSDELPVSIHPDGKNGWIAWFGKHPVSAETTLSAYPNGGGFKCPYGQPGDRLWVRETFITGCEMDENGYFMTDDAGNHIDKIWYRASTPDLVWYDGDEDSPGDPRWKPSIFMPRSASRLTLEITAVRVERLQDISRADAIAEGLDFVPDGAAAHGIKGLATSWNNDPRKSYRALWESINGDGSWAANPFVWVIEFNVLQGGVPA